MPAISSPASASVGLGQSFNYDITASGSPNSYTLVGTLPPGLNFSAASGVISGLPESAGIYDVTIGAGNIFGSGQEALTITVAPSAPLQVSANASVPGSGSRLVNLSARAICGNGNQNLVVGFVIAGAATQVLTRGVGPALAAFGMTDQLGDPQLTLYAGATSLGSNTGWGGSALLAAAFAQAGAFSFANGSHDSAILSTLSPGSYSAEVSGPGGSSGVALGEVYDEDTSANSAGKLSNFSARAEVGTSSNVLVAGFVIEGNSPKQVLIRAIGPGLTQFGVTGVLAQPQIDLYQGTSVLQHNNGWGGGQTLAAAFAQVGAFALSSPQDSAMLVTLNPGAYTAEVSGADGGTGVALVEIYDML
ncbi:MAG TPA: Ig domain-containing protein [Opitutaceae bacterium]